jgi:antitoxin YxxD
MISFDDFRKYNEGEYSSIKTEQYSENKHLFFTLSSSEIQEVSKDFFIPEELFNFYLILGYGWLNNRDKNSFNRLMSPISLRMINLREEYYEFDPELDSYEKRYNGEKLLFFEVNEGIYLAIDKTSVNGKNAVYLFDKKIADSLFEFLIAMDKNENFINEQF